MEFYQFISFLRQLGLAVSGAACLWGLVFIFLSRKKGVTEIYSHTLEWMGRRLSWLLYGGATLALVSWTVLLSLNSVSAHEGITLTVPYEDALRAATHLVPVYALLALSLLAGLFFKNFRHKIIWSRFSLFYLINFVLIFVAISYYTDLTVLPLSEASFHIFHGFHSIFTLGTVLTLDFMFLSSRSSDVLARHIYPLFPQISKVIWIGLSFDLFSVFLIFPEAVVLSSRFFFAQTVVGILIINGVLLSGVITRKLLAFIHNSSELPKKLSLVASLCGTISVSSWSAITFVDFFPSLTLSYWALVGIYMLLITVLFIGHSVWERLDVVRLNI